MIFISLLLGAGFGIILHYWIPEGYVRDTVIINGVFYVVGNGFLRAMQMLVVPLVFCSIVCGSMSIRRYKNTRKVGVKAMGFYLVTTALAITLALSVANLIDPGVGMDVSSLETAEAAAAGGEYQFCGYITEYYPEKPDSGTGRGKYACRSSFSRSSSGYCLQSAEREVLAVAQFFSQFNDLMMDMTMAVMKAAPIGVFCLIAKTFAGIGFDAFLPMLKYMAAVFLALMLQGFGVYQILLKLLTGLNPIKFIKKFFPVMAFAFSTATSNATIPLSIETLDKKMGVSKRISSFTIPLGATINMDGTAIMQGVAVVFVSQAFGIPLTLTDYLTVIATATIASIGTAGVPSVGLITLSMVFTSVGLPVEGIALIMGIDRILDMTRTAVNITGDAVCTTIIAHQNKELRREVYERMEQKGE